MRQDTGIIPLRILIAGDVASIRHEPSTLLSLAGDFLVAGEAANAREALLMSGILTPDAVVMDLEIAGFNGLDAIREIKALYPAIRIVALSMHGGPGYRCRALESGADSFLVKGTAPDALFAAIREIKPDI